MQHRILFLAANPRDTDCLRLGEEAREIRKGIRSADYRDGFEFCDRWAVRVHDVLSEFASVKPQIVHFSGHGSGDAEIILEDETGAAHAVPKSALVSLFEAYEGRIRLVLLNACFSAHQAAAISAHVDCVVGMQRTINDAAAIQFAREFYRELANGESVQHAYKIGCIAIGMYNSDAPDTPQLLLHPGVDSCNMRFDFGTAVEAEESLVALQNMTVTHKMEPRCKRATMTFILKDEHKIERTILRTRWWSWRFEFALDGQLEHTRDLPLWYIGSFRQQVRIESMALLLSYRHVGPFIIGGIWLGDNLLL